MGFSFKKLAEQAVAQLNPFDGGKTASTVRQKQQAQPAVTQRSNQPSYGGGITGVTNWARDKVDANTPQDRWKRQQQKRPELDFTVQDDIRQKLNQVKQTASDVNTTANQVANKYVAPVAKIATSPIAANIDGGKALVGQLTGNQQARNNALGQLKNNSLAVPKVAYNTLIDPAVKTGQAIGENAATAFSGDARRAEQAQTLLTDQLESQKLSAYKQARQGFQDQGQVDRFNKYADSLWNDAGQARTDQINAQQEKYNKIDPVKNTALIADAGLTAASFGVAGVTKAGMKAAATKVTESAVSKGISKDVAMGLGQKAARSNLIKNTLGTGAMGAVQGGISPYITKEPGTVTGKDVMGGALLGGTMGSVLPATFAKMGGGNLNLRPQLRATADEVLALSNFRSQMGGMIEPDVYSKGVAVAQKYGIDHGTPRGVDEIDNIIGSHRTFVNNQPPARAGLLQPMGQQGGVPNPLQAFDKLKNKLNNSALDTTVKPATPENVYGVNALEKLGKKLKMNQGGYIRTPGKEPITLYHGGAGADEITKNGVKILTPEEKLKFPSSGGGYVGLSTTADKEYAKQFSRNIAGNDRVAEINLNPKAKILELKPGQAIDDMSADELTAISKKYDVIKSVEDNEYRVLTENGVRKKPLFKPMNQGGGIPNPAYDPLDALKAEAKKYKSADEFVKAQQTKAGEYVGSHQAPTRDIDNYHAPASDVTGGSGMFPNDIYTDPKAYHYYGHGGDARTIAMDKKSIELIRSIKGKPDAEVTMYRAVPKGKTSEINKGDWVTLNKDYAQQHNTSQFDGKGTILEKKVKADELYTDGNSVHEFGYDPRQPSKQELTDLYNQATKPKSNIINRALGLNDSSQGGFAKLPGKGAPIGKTEGVAPTDSYIKKIRQPIEKELKEAQAEMDKYGTGYINDIDLAAKQAKAKARLDKAREADFQNTESKIRSRNESAELNFKDSWNKVGKIADQKSAWEKSEPWYKAREDIKNNYISKFKNAEDFVSVFNSSDKRIPTELKHQVLEKYKNLFSGSRDIEAAKKTIEKDLADFYNEVKSPTPPKGVAPKSAPDNLDTLKTNLDKTRQELAPIDKRLTAEFTNKSKNMTEEQKSVLFKEYQAKYEKETASIKKQQADIESSINNYKKSELPDNTTASEVGRLIKESHSKNTFDPKNTGYFINLSKDNIKNITPLKGIDDYGDTMFVDTDAGISTVSIQDWSESGQGFRVSNGNGNEIARFNTDAEARDFARKALTVENEAARQGKRVILSGSRVENRTKSTPVSAPIEKTITPENLTVVKEYSQMLKSMDDGARGGQMVGNYSDGYKRVTEHSKFYSDYFAKNKRAPSNKAYEEEALRQLKNGQADSYAQKTFDDLQDPEFRSLASEVEKGSLGKQPLGETFDIPQTATVKTDVKPKAKTNFSKDLPEYDTKKVGLLDKAFRSTRSVIERQGKSGKELAGMLQSQRDSKELWAREIEKRLRTVQKLKDKEFSNFVEATQGKENPMNDKVVKAIEDWKSVHPHIRQRGVDAGLEIGDLGDNYYPHFIDYDKIYKDKNTYNQAINHLVNTGQADTKEKAIELLGFARDTSRNREFGSLEASRIVDLPFYDKTKASLASYIQGSTDRITKTETFGKSDENALKLIKKIAVEGGDTEAAKNAYDIAVGARNYNHTASKISSGIRHYTTVTRLGLGALTNVSQSVNTGIVTGHFRTMGAMLKQLDPKTRQFAEDTGVISDAILNDLRRGFGQETFGSSKVGKAVNVITAPGFKQIESFNRRVAATAGKDYALRLAQKGDDKSINILRKKLGVTGEIDGTLSERQQIQAARKIVEKTQFKVDAQDLPGWTASPGGKLVAQFRTFSYSQGKFFSNEILKPASKGNFMPLGRLMAALPVGYGLYETRRMIDGRPEEENKMKRGLSAFQKVGGAGLAMDAYFALNPLNSKYLPSDRRVSMAGSFLGGPSVGTAMNAVGSLSDMVQRKNSPTDQSRLDGKIALGNNGDTYTDATSFARFGMQQIPIVASPIMNRVLPYKKSSEADAGKSTQTASSSGTAVKDLKEAKAITKSGYGKEWAKLSEDDIKNKAIEGDEQAQQVYDSLKAMEKVYAPKNVPTKGLSQSAEDILNKSKKFTESGKKAWGSKETANTEAKTAIKTWAGEDIPVTNEIAVEWAKFEKKRLEGKISDLEMNKEKKSVLKKAYSSTLSEDEKGYYNVSDTDILSGLDQGLVTTESLKKAMDVDAKLVAKGLITKSGFGVKVWNALGLAQPKTGGGSGKVAKGSKGRKSGGKSGKTASRFKYDLYGFGASPTSTSKRLRQLVEEASKSSKKA